MINVMGQKLAEESPINALVRAQLEHVYKEVIFYLPNHRRVTAGSKIRLPKEMPHEWGSIDSYDDMRNSLRLAADLMDMLIARPIMDDGDPKDWVNEALRDSGICSAAEEVIAFVGGEDAHYEWMEAHQ